MLRLNLDVLLAKLEEVVGSEGRVVLGCFGCDARGGRGDVRGGAVRARGGGSVGTRTTGRHEAGSISGEMSGVPDFEPEKKAVGESSHRQ